MLGPVLLSEGRALCVLVGTEEGGAALGQAIAGTDTHSHP